MIGQASHRLSLLPWVAPHRQPRAPPAPSSGCSPGANAQTGAMRRRRPWRPWRPNRPWQRGTPQRAATLTGALGQRFAWQGPPPQTMFFVVTVVRRSSRTRGHWRDALKRVAFRLFGVLSRSDESERCAVGEAKSATSNRLAMAAAPLTRARSVRRPPTTESRRMLSKVQLHRSRTTLYDKQVAADVRSTGKA